MIQHSHLNLTYLIEQGQNHRNTSEHTRWTLIERTLRGQAPYTWEPLTLTYVGVNSGGDHFFTAPNDPKQGRRSTYHDQSTWRYFDIDVLGFLESEKTYHFVAIGDGTKTRSGKSIRFPLCVVDELRPHGHAGRWSASNLHLPDSYDPDGYLMHLIERNDAWLTKLEAEALTSDPKDAQ